MVHQTYLQDCECTTHGVILYDGKAICRWCRKPYAKGGLIGYSDAQMPPATLAVDLGSLLFHIHEHDEKSEKIVYYEEDLLPMLEALGLPKPEWGGNLSLQEFIEKKNKIV